MEAHMLVFRDLKRHCGAGPRCIWSCYPDPLELADSEEAAECG